MADSYFVFLYGHDPDVGSALRTLFTDVGGYRVHDLDTLTDAAPPNDHGTTPRLLLVGLDRQHPNQDFYTALRHCLVAARQQHEVTIGFSTNPAWLAEPLRELLSTHDVPIVVMPFELDDLVDLAQSRVAVIVGAQLR